MKIHRNKDTAIWRRERERERERERSIVKHYFKVHYSRTAFREAVESGEGFSRNEVTHPVSSTSSIPTLLVATVTQHY